MKLTLHLVRKDFLRLSGWLALWVLIFAVKAGTGFYVRSLTSEYSYTLILNVTDLTRILVTAQGVVSFLLTLLLIQDDPLVGSRQFWITRPISGGRLLTAKMLVGALMFVGLPALIMLPWWLTCGFGIPEIAVAMAQLAVIEFVIALPAAMVASLTDSIQRAVLWSVALLAVAMTAGVFWKTLVLDAAGGDHGLAWTRTVLPVAVVVITLTLVLVLQFLTRRSKISFAALGFGLVAAITIAGAWPKTIVVPYIARERHAELAANVKVALNGPADFSSGVDKNEDDYAHLSMTARGDCGDRMVVAYSSPMFVWRWPDSFRLARLGWLQGQSGSEYFLRNALHLGSPMIDLESEQQRDLEWQRGRERTLKRIETTNAARAEKGLPPVQFHLSEARWKGIPISKPDETGFRGEVRVPAAFRERAQKEPPTFSTKISLRLWRPEVWFEVPLRAEGWQRQGARTVRILKVGTDPKNRGAAPIAFVETAPFTWLEGWLVVCFPRRDREFVIYEQLRGTTEFMNRKLGFLEYGGGYDERHKTMLIGGVQITWHSAAAHSPQISRNGQWIDWQPDWQDNTTLVMWNYREEARFEREVSAERFEVK